MIGRFALTGATLIDGTGRDPLEQAIVVVEGSTIVDVGRGTDVRLNEGTCMLDASGATVMPGIIDALAEWYPTLRSPPREGERPLEEAGIETSGGFGRPPDEPA
jgi:predicted amidohydrolase